MLRIAVVLVSLGLVLLATPAQAHGTTRIRERHFSIIDEAAKASGTYVTSQKHAHLRVTVFIISGSGRILGEKTRQCDSGGCRRVHVQLKLPCTHQQAVYAVIQGDVRGGQHFAFWNSKTLVC